MNYFITALTAPPINKDWRSKTFGYYSTLEKAIEVMESNLCGLDECFYDFVVIEPLPEGIYPSLRKEDNKDNLWFEWVLEGEKITGYWKRINNIPKGFENILGFALG